jgi:hypothetical protein
MKKVAIIPALIGAIAVIVAAIIGILPNIRGPSPPPLTRFEVDTPKDGASLKFNVNGHTFEGRYTPVPAKGIDVYPIVQAPDNNYWPNPKVNLMADGKWNAIVYIGNPNNPSGEVFEIFFVSASSDSKASEKIRAIVDTRGAQSLGQNLPKDINILTRRVIKSET